MVFGPFLAHWILAGSWVIPPPLVAAFCALSGKGHGAKGILFGGAMLPALLLVPANYTCRGAVCTILSTLALTAPNGLAVFSAAAATVMTWLVTCKNFASWPGFYHFIVQTLQGHKYYAEVGLKGAVDQITPGKNFFACHPHGCLSAGWSWNMCWNSEFHKRVGPICFLIDQNLRYVNPFFRMVCDWYAGETRRIDSADRKSIKQAMNKGESLALIPGGFEDATVMQRGKERTAVKKRKGFVKYCLEGGYRIIPVYTFGECDTYYTFKPLMKFRLWLNKFGIPAVIFFGNPCCPIFPRTDVPVITYVGEPVELPQIANPSPEDVEKWHGAYLTALQSLFDKYKDEAGKPDAKLEIW